MQFASDVFRSRFDRVEFWRRRQYYADRPIATSRRSRHRDAIPLAPESL
jgi:hypothetical protein